MTDEIKLRLEKINSFEKVFKELSEQMMSPPQPLFPLDMLAIGVINRSLSLLSGFVTLVEKKNFIGAAHLARPHLDNYLRFSAAWLVENPHEFAMKVMQGERVDQLIDRNGNKLRDSYLVEVANNRYPWMPKVYKETSGFVHLSKKHVFTSTILKDKNSGVVEFRIGTEDRYVPDESRLEAAECMIEITNCVIYLLEGWIWTKNNPDELNKTEQTHGT